MDFFSDGLFFNGLFCGGIGGAKNNFFQSVEMMDGAERKHTRPEEQHFKFDGGFGCWRPPRIEQIDFTITANLMTGVGMWIWIWTCWRSMGNARGSGQK
jgi:hypothetical protein